MTRPALPAACLALLLAGVAGASAGETRRPSFHGYLLGIRGSRLTGDRPSPGAGSAIMGESRLRLESDWSSPDGKTYLLLKGDEVLDFDTGDVDEDWREAYVGRTRGAWDARLGRQIVTWGVGDMFAVNEVFPKDWESYFLGRPMDYLKLGVDALKLSYSGPVYGVDALAISSFTPDRLPSGRRFFSYNPYAGIPARTEERPGGSNDGERALRLTRKIGGVDLALYGYHGFQRTPAASLDIPAAPTRVAWHYPRLRTCGMSAQGNALGGILGCEIGHHRSLDDASGLDPLIPNSQWRFLTNYQRDLGNDLTAGVQYYGEWMENYSGYRGTLPAGSPAQKRLRSLVSARLTKWMSYHTWMLSLFAACGVTERDYYVKPEIIFKKSDRISYFLNANVFGGNDATTFFGRFDKNDNVAVGVRLDY